jgi:hypothetical protein
MLGYDTFQTIRAPATENTCNTKQQNWCRSDVTCHFNCYESCTQTTLRPVCDKQFQLAVEEGKN